MVEYGLLLSLIALTVFGAFQQLGWPVRASLMGVSMVINGAEGTPMELP